MIELPTRPLADSEAARKLRLPIDELRQLADCGGQRSGGRDEYSEPVGTEPDPTGIPDEDTPF